MKKIAIDFCKRLKKIVSLRRTNAIRSKNDVLKVGVKRDESKHDKHMVQRPFFRH